jgi:hypothetical protein
MLNCRFENFLAACLINGTARRLTIVTQPFWFHCGSPKTAHRAVPFRYSRYLEAEIALCNLTPRTHSSSRIDLRFGRHNICTETISYE